MITLIFKALRWTKPKIKRTIYKALHKQKLMSTPQTPQAPIDEEREFCERLEYFMGVVFNNTSYETDFKRWFPARGKTTLPRIYREVKHKWDDDNDLLEQAANFALGFMDATTKNLHHIKNKVYDIGYREGEETLAIPRESTSTSILNKIKAEIRKITH